jgi:predicted glutamine amidotransferase
MCRWLAYSGSPIAMEALVSLPKNSLIHQSMDSAMGATAINADGFGVGWYVEGDPIPALFKSVQPAWADQNLAELARHIKSPLFMAHVRATTGTPVQQTNCHPYRYDNWLWLHNGAIREFDRVKRDLLFAVDPMFFTNIKGTTDSELMFHLALTFGLLDDPVTAVEKMIGFVEEVGRAHGVQYPIQMTVGAADGTSLYAFRYSSEGQSRTLFYSRDLPTLKELHPDVELLRELHDETRVIVSEPLGDQLPGAWVETPESHYGIVRPGDDLLAPLEPKLP